MLLRELLTEVRTRYLQGSEETEVGSLAIDSREVTLGAAFICIPGAVYDGHEFAAQALEKGARALIVEREDEAFLEGLGGAAGEAVIVLVESARIALARMSAAWYGYPDRELITIGITGTKGKTTSTYMVKSILENAGRRVGLIGTNEVIIGRKHTQAGNTTPESLVLHRIFREMLEAGLDTVVMEVSSQAVKLCRTEGILFDYGIFTNLSPDHIAPAEHRDFEEYLACKRQLFRQCKTGLINGDDAYAEAVTQGHTCRLETFGMGPDCMLRAENIRFVRGQGRLGMEFQVCGLMDFPVQVPLPGRFSVYNALTAISICRQFRVRESDIQRSMLAARVRGRIEPVSGPKDYTVLIDYAHNPISLESLLNTLREYRPRRLICLFGCGGNRPVLRRRQMGRISGRLADLSILTSDNPRDEDPLVILEQIREGAEDASGKYVVIPDRKEAIRYALQTAREGDIIVLAGKGHEDYQEIRGVKYPMDERTLVQEILAE